MSDNNFLISELRTEKFTKVAPYLEYENGTLYEVLEEGDMGAKISKVIDAKVVDKIKAEIINDISIENSNSIILNIEGSNVDLSNNTQDFEIIISTISQKVKEGLDDIGVKYSRVSITNIDSLFNRL